VGAGDADAPAVSGLWTLTVTAVQGTSMEGRNASFYQQIAEDVLDLITPELRERFRLGMRTHGDRTRSMEMTSC
jgi:hypothetical protein